MKFIKNSIDSELLQVSISDADMEKQMANCDMESEVVNGHHSENMKSSEKIKMEEVVVAKLTNGIHGKSGSPAKCNGKVNGFYEEVEDFNLVLEESSEGSESPLKKIDDDAISAPQIVQEIEDLLGINSSSAGIQEELNNLDGTESIEDNLDNNIEDIEDTNSQETQEEKNEEFKEVDSEKKESTGEMNKLSDKILETSECDTSSNMNVVFDEVEVGLESDDVQCSNESKLTTDTDEICDDLGSSTETNNIEEIKDCDSSENLVNIKVVTSQAHHSNIEISGKTEENTENEIALTQTSGSLDSSEEWMVVDSVETSEEEKLSESQELPNTPEITKSKLPENEKCSDSECSLKSKIDCPPSEQVDAEILEHSLEAKDTSEKPRSTSILPSEGECVRKRSASTENQEVELCVRKRSASTENQEVELKKPKLEEHTLLVESSPPVLKRFLPETTENESKRTKLSHTTEESTKLNVEACHVQDESEKIDDITVECVKENQIADGPMKSILVENIVLDEEKIDSKDEMNSKSEEKHTAISSSSESPKTLCANNCEVQPATLNHQQQQEKKLPDVSVSQDNGEGGKIDSTCLESTSLLKDIIEITSKEDEPSDIKTSSKQNSDEILMDKTLSGCDESKIKSEDKIQDDIAIKQENISDENKGNASNSIIDGPREKTDFELHNSSSIPSKEFIKSEQVKEMSECLIKTETKATDHPKNVNISSELSSSIKELEKSINKSGPEKIQHSMEPKNSDSKKMTNLDFAIERVVEKARLQTEKKVPILKKFHKDQLKKLKRSELEEIVVSKICEAVTYKSEIGQMRLRTQNLEEANDMWRKKVHQIEKQNRELDMILKRFLNELAVIKRENQDKVPIPIKVTRSVGLQVVLASSMHGALLASRNKTNAEPTQQQQQTSVKAKQAEKAKEVVRTTTFVPPPPAPASNPSTLVRGRGRPAKTQTSQISRPSTPQSVPSKVTPPATPAKPANLTPMKTIPTPRKDLEVIDLTDREERSKSASQSPVNGSIRVAPNTQVQVFVQQSSAPSPPQQPVYLLQKAGPRQQILVAASSATPQRPMANLPRPPPALSLPVFRAGGHYIPVQTTPVNTVGVKTTTNTTPPTVTRQVPSAVRIQPQPPVNRHPAPLPTAPAVASKPGMKAPPPKPQLKIAKTANGIMLSWSMGLNKDMADMQSYQLYAYQEGNQPPSTGLWKKVGDVKALPLPMACTLTQFIEGHKYHFAVRAVDVHGRVGPFSTPSSILLTK